MHSTELTPGMTSAIIGILPLLWANLGPTKLLIPLDLLPSLPN